VSRYCPHCKSPARGNPCWFYLDNPRAAEGGWDAPCTMDEYEIATLKREQNFGRNVTILVVLMVAAAVAATWWWR
jgi:hypothetical protein